MQSTPHPARHDATPATSRRSIRRAALAATTMAAVGASMLAASPAQAATANPYTPNGVCGSTFSIIDQHPLERSTVYLLRSSYGSRYCVMTRMNQIDGTRGLMASLWTQGAGGQTDVNVAYKYYASVTWDTANTCIQWAGWDASSSFRSEWGHCGGTW